MHLLASEAVSTSLLIKSLKNYSSLIILASSGMPSVFPSSPKAATKDPHPFTRTNLSPILRARSSSLLQRGKVFSLRNSWMVHRLNQRCLHGVPTAWTAHDAMQCTAVGDIVEHEGRFDWPSRVLLKPARSRLGFFGPSL